MPNLIDDAVKTMEFTNSLVALTQGLISEAAQHTADAALRALPSYQRK